jgi:hypothetical protein
MASIVVAGDTSGTVTLSAPATAGTTTLTLPTTSGTVLTSASSVASSQLPAGSVLQVVNATYAVTTANTSGSYVASGLTASITPSSASNRILVIVNQLGCGKDGNTYMLARLRRGATVLAVLSGGSGYTNTTTSNNFGTLGMTWLDSPATTSSTTYSTEFATAVAPNTVYVQGNSENSTITLMEIKG